MRIDGEMCTIISGPERSYEIPFRPPEPSHEMLLEAKLKSFVNLYDQHEDRLQGATESFTQTAARVREAQEVAHANRVIRGCALGAVSGGIIGGVGGVLGSVAASVVRGAIVGMFGRTVGAAGGAVGGGLGALLGTRYAVDVVGGEREKKEISKEENVMQTGLDFSETVKPLLLELSAIKNISEKLESAPEVQRVTRQTEKTLAAAAVMEETVADPQRDKDLTQFEEVAKRSRRVCEELKTTRTEAETLLTLLRRS